MNYRVLSGSVLAYLYNRHVGRWPSRRLRMIFLRSFLGSCGAEAGVQMDCSFLQMRKTHLGDRTIVNFGCVLDGRKHEIRTGTDVSIGPEAAILTLGHDPNSEVFADRGGAVVIGDRAWIAFRAVILPGVSIGEGAVVAAGAVVSKDVPPFTVVAGNPARVVSERSHKLSYTLRHAPFLR